METIKWLIQELDKHSGAVSAILTAALISATVYYSLKAKKQADEAGELRKLQYETFQYQKENEELNRLEVIRKSARIIYADLFAAINEIIQVAQIRKGISYYPQNIQYYQDYSIYLANLGEKLELSEIILVKKIYGMIGRYSREYLNNNYKNINKGQWQTNVLEVAENIGADLFDGHERYYSTAEATTYKVFYDLLIIGYMEQQYKQLFIKLKELIK